MKQLFLSLIALFSAFTMFAQQNSTYVAVFKSDVIDMGKIPMGVPATATFTVNNVGKTPLIIERADPTCGCTIGNYTKEPIAPGATGTISATYNAANPGTFTKTLKVKLAGFDDLRDITIKGDVVSKEEYAAANPEAKIKEKTEAKDGTVETKVKTTNVPTAPKKTKTVVKQ